MIAPERLLSAIGQYPEDAAMHYRVAGLYMELGKPGQAIDFFHQANRLGISTSRLFLDLSRAYARNGQNAESLNWLQKSIKAGFTDFKSLENDPCFKNIALSAFSTSSDR